MPIKAYALPDRTVRAIETLERAIETLERAVNTASGPTVTASCDDITALIDSIDDLLNTWTNPITQDNLHNMRSSDLGYFIREMSSELWVRMMAVEFSQSGGDQ